MKMLLRHSLLLTLFLAFAPGLHAAPPGAGFTYQGRLQRDNCPADGLYDFLFHLYDAPISGNQVGPGLSTNAVSVSDGLFTVELNFGPGVFTGETRWLHISVQTNGGARYTSLLPRQPVTPAPTAYYARDAGMASHATTAGGLTASNLTAAAANTMLVTARTLTVESDSLTNNVAGDAACAIGLNASETVGGNLDVAIGNTCHLTTGSDVAAALGRHLTAAIVGNCNLGAGENLILHASDDLTVTADNEILLETGTASIHMQKTGDIRIRGKDIIIDASGKIITSSNSPPAFSAVPTESQPVTDSVPPVSASAVTLEALQTKLAEQEARIAKLERWLQDFAPHGSRKIP